MKYLARIAELIAILFLGTFAALLTVNLPLSASSDLAGLGPGYINQMDLTLAMTVPTHLAPGNPVVVEIAYGNLGDASAPNTQLTATLPPGMEFMGATNGAGEPMPPTAIEGTTLMWSLGEMPAATCCQSLRLAERPGETLVEGQVVTHTARIGATGVESYTVNNRASADSLITEMAGSYKYVHAHRARPGDVLTYTIVVNWPRREGWNGAAPEAAPPTERVIELTDTLPAGNQVRFLGWTDAITGAQHEGQRLLWQGRLRAGEPITLQYRLGIEGVVTPGTIISNMARLGWGAGHMQLGPVTTVITLPDNARMLGPNGGQWRHGYGVSLTVPPGAVTDTLRFEFEWLHNYDYDYNNAYSTTREITPPHGLQFGGKAFDLKAYRFGESVRQFGQPITLAVEYDDRAVTGIKRDTLRLWYRNSEGEPWAMLGEPVRHMSGTLSFTTTHLTEFALFGEPAADLTLTATAPQHVVPGSVYTVNLAYDNAGDEAAPNTWLTATLSDDADFVYATNRDGDALPPDSINGNVLAWNLGTIVSDTCCGHIRIAQRASADVAHATALTTSAVIASDAVDANLLDNRVDSVTLANDMAGSHKQYQYQGPGPQPGDVMTCTIVVSMAQRSGPANQQRMVVLSETLPVSHQLRFLGWAGSVTGTQSGAQMLKWQGMVRAGQPITIQYRLGVEGDVPVGTIISSQTVLEAGMEPMSFGPASAVVTMSQGSMALGPNQAGELHHGYGFSLTVPRGAVTDTTRFEFRPLTATGVLTGPPGMMYAHRAFELTAFRFGEEVRQFNHPLTITLAYSSTDVAGLNRESLRLWSRNGEGEPWASLGEPTQRMSGTLSVSTTHFTQFALFAQGGTRVYLPRLSR